VELVFALAAAAALAVLVKIEAVFVVDVGTEVEEFPLNSVEWSSLIFLAGGERSIDQS
jgi:hypothetical protein